MFNTNILLSARENTNFRKVLFTGKYSQLVVMSLKVGEDIGLETHLENDQLLLFVDGTAHVVIGEDEADVKADDIVAVPAGLAHNVTNSGSSELKLITVYGPADHKPGTVHATKADALDDERTPEV